MVHTNLLCVWTVTKAREMLMGLSASGVDSVIRGLGFDPDRELIELDQMLTYLTSELSARRNFEVNQAHLNLFLNVHQSTLLQIENIEEKLLKLQQFQRNNWRRLEDGFYSSMCMLGFFSGIQL